MTLEELARVGCAWWFITKVVKNFIVSSKVWTCFFLSSHRIRFKGDEHLILNQARSFFKGNRGLILNKSGPRRVSHGGWSLTFVQMIGMCLLCLLSSTSLMKNTSIWMFASLRISGRLGGLWTCFVCLKSLLMNECLVFIGKELSLVWKTQFQSRNLWDQM